MDFGWKISNYKVHPQLIINFIGIILRCREAAKNGHGHGAYNLVAGHLQGYDTDVEEQ